MQSKIKFVKIGEACEISALAVLASEIWHEYWKKRLTDDQIEYMIEEFQSEAAIVKQIEEQGYEYYFINKESDNVGYFGICNKKEDDNYLFLSKLYIKDAQRGQGLGAKTFAEIKSIALGKGLRSIRLTVNKYNTNTIEAYKHWGFETVDECVTDIGRGFVMDDYIMEYKV